MLASFYTIGHEDDRQLCTIRGRKTKQVKVNILVYRRLHVTNYFRVLDRFQKRATSGEEDEDMV